MVSSMTETRLDSWKEIAAYLHRDVSTVRRWEKREGLPVHRHLHAKLGSVYAYPAEIDEWCRSRRNARRSTEQSVQTPQPESDSRPSHVVWLVAVALAVVVSLVIVAGLRAPKTADGGKDSRLHDTRYTQNGDVYELYLRGRYLWKKRTPEAAYRAISAFSRAIELDPAYAPAYAGLADTYITMGFYGAHIPFDEARSKARAAAARALALDDSLAEAHVSMASLMEFDRWDWAGAERQYRRAIELAPNNASAYHWYANNLSLQGRHDEAIAAGKQAVALDPLVPIFHVALGHAYLVAGRTDEAIGQLTKALEIEPQSANAHHFLGVAYQQKGKLEEALAEMRQAAALDESWLWKAHLAHLYTVMNRREDALQVVAEFDALRPQVSRLTAAALYAAVGERERPLMLLEKACTEREPDVGFMKIISPFDSLRNDPVFQLVLRRIGLS
jgi:tetratricopeptide (TPR) repeat protein